MSSEIEVEPQNVVRDAGDVLFSAEGVVPASAYSVPFSLSEAARHVVLLLAGFFVLSIADAWQGYAFAALTLAVPSFWLATQARNALATRAATGTQSQRFEITADGIRHVATAVTGEKIDRHYDWFMFSHLTTEPHRLLLWLRVPRNGGSRLAEILLIPAAIFGPSFDDVAAFLATKVSAGAPATTGAPTVRSPSDRRKTLALWVVLVAAFFALYWAFTQR